MVAFRNISVEKPVALVVESDPSLRRLTAAILRQSGYRVVESSQGAENWDIDGSGDVLEVLVVGLNLSGGRSGLGVAKRVWEKNPATRIIVTGASGPDETEMSMVRNAGMTFLSLPYSFARLSQAAAAPSSWAA